LDIDRITKNGGNALGVQVKKKRRGKNERKKKKEHPG
jgi:hypothetical protein